MLYRQVLEEILEVPVVSSRGRSSPRAVKRKLDRYPIRRKCGEAKQKREPVEVEIIAEIP